MAPYYSIVANVGDTDEPETRTINSFNIAEVTDSRVIRVALNSIGGMLSNVFSKPYGEATRSRKRNTTALSDRFRRQYPKGAQGSGDELIALFGGYRKIKRRGSIQKGL